MPFGIQPIQVFMIFVPILALVVIILFIVLAIRIILRVLKGKTKVCPFCAERILLAAVVCPHCGRDLPPQASK